MPRKKITFFSGIFFIILVSLFLSSPARAQLKDDLKMKLEMRKIQDTMKETQEETKRTQQEIKEIQDKEKDALDKMKQDRLNIERTQESLRRTEAVMRQRQKPPAAAGYDTELLQQNILKILLVLSIILFIYFSAQMLTREKKLPLEAQKDLLAKVENWTFFETELKKYLDKLKFIIDPRILEINSPDFKKNFVRDLMLTEILFRVSAQFHKGRDLDFSSSQSDPLANLDTLQGRDYAAHIQKYKDSLHDEKRAYSGYYKALFFFLLYVNKEDAAKTFELYKKYLLIKELIEDKQGNVILPEEKIKEHVNRYISREKVFLRTE